MLEQTTTRSDGKGFFPEMMGIKIVEQKDRVLDGAADLKDRVGEAFDDAMSNAKRFAKKGRYAAADLIDDAEYTIKKAPFRSVWMTFAAGMGVGLVTGIVVSRMTGMCSNQGR